MTLKLMPWILIGFLFIGKFGCTVPYGRFESSTYVADEETLVGILKAEEGTVSLGNTVTVHSYIRNDGDSDVVLPMAPIQTVAIIEKVGAEVGEKKQDVAVFQPTRETITVRAGSEVFFGSMELDGQYFPTEGQWRYTLLYLFSPEQETDLKKIWKARILKVPCNDIEITVSNTPQ